MPMDSLPDNERLNNELAGSGSSRREFLKSVSAAGLLLSFNLAPVAFARPASATAAFNAYVHIATDNTVTIMAAHPDVGQGVRTSLPMLIAEELDANWDNVRVEQAPFDEQAYGRQRSGGSRTIPTNYDKLRRVGAATRSVLVSAAAKTWNCPVGECRTEPGYGVHSATGKRLSYGALVPACRDIDPPPLDSVSLKKPGEFRLVGKPLAQFDTPRIVTGQPLYGMDVVLPGMLYAACERAPVYGSQVDSVDLKAAKAVKGVRDIFVIEGKAELYLRAGVAVVADSWWAANKARGLLDIKWTEHPDQKASTGFFDSRAKALAREEPAETIRDDGDVASAFSKSLATVEAAYSYPYVAHATLEPMNCTAEFRDGKVTVWTPLRAPKEQNRGIAAILGIPSEDVEIKMIRAGGAFGRRARPDFSGEAALVSKRVGAPVKVIWTREDDLRQDFYRPAGYHYFRGGVDKQGRISAWHDHFVTFGENNQAVSMAGLSDSQFPARFIKNFRIDVSYIPHSLPTGPWRAPGSNANAFAMQSFIDELAHAASADPVKFRLELLGNRKIVGDGHHAYNAERMRGVLEAVARMSNWEQRDKLPDREGKGVAFHYSHAGYFAEVVHVKVEQDGTVRPLNAWVAGDVGSTIINPSGAINQVQGSVLDGLSTALYQRITVANGAAVEGNFNDYRLMRINEAPPVEVEFVLTDNPPTGLGEPALPPAIPALTNAIFAATGTRIRRLPVETELLKT